MGSIPKCEIHVLGKKTLKNFKTSTVLELFGLYKLPQKHWNSENKILVKIKPVDTWLMHVGFLSVIYWGIALMFASLLILMPKLGFYILHVL